MTFKKNVIACVALCITAILMIALCGCDDLGDYEDTEEYYDAFGDVVMIDGALIKTESYSVEDYFYNEESRENFLVDDNGEYNGIAHGKYVYIAIPFEKEIEMDSFAIYIQSQEDVALYINFYVVDNLPMNWCPIGGDQTNGDQTNGDQTNDDQTNGDQTGGDQTNGDQTNGDQTNGDQTNGDQTGGDQTNGDQTGGDQTNGDQTGGDQTNDDQTNGGSGEDEEETDYDDPAPEERVGEIVIHLESGKWNSLILEYFAVAGEQRDSIQIMEDQYLLLQIRNNSGLRIFDQENGVFVDPQTGLELKEANITVTNLLIRAFDIKDGS